MQWDNSKKYHIQHFPGLPTAIHNQRYWVTWQLRVPSELHSWWNHFLPPPALRIKWWVKSMLLNGSPDPTGQRPCQLLRVTAAKQEPYASGKWEHLGVGKGRVMDDHRPGPDHVHSRYSRGRTLPNSPQTLEFKTHKWMSQHSRGPISHSGQRAFTNENQMTCGPYFNTLTGSHSPSERAPNLYCYLAGLWHGP